MNVGLLRIGQGIHSWFKSVVRNNLKNGDGDDGEDVP
jgi:hypothetical protein